MVASLLLVATSAKMKLNLCYPINGTQKLVEIDDDAKLRLFYDKRIAAEVPADTLGDEYAGYVLRIMGGNDKPSALLKARARSFITNPPPAEWNGADVLKSKTG